SRRTGLWAAGAAIAVLAVLTAPEWSRMVDFGGFRAFRTSNLSGGLGNLRHQLSPLEAFGIWPTSEFRLAAADSSHPAAFYLAAAILAYVGARLLGTVYTSAKALAIAAPLVTLVAFGGLLGDGPGRRRLIA